MVNERKDVPRDAAEQVRKDQLGEGAADGSSQLSLPTRKELGDARVTINLTGLTTEQQQELIKKHAELTIETHNRALQIATDVGGLDAALSTMGKHSRETAEAGGSITITKTQDDNLGRTEIIMGTSDAARSGKLTRSQQGLARSDQALWIIIAVIIGVAIVIAALLK